MKLLLLIIGLTLSSLAQAQRDTNPYALPNDKDPYDKVLIIGEAEARAGVLKPVDTINSKRQYESFVSRVAAAYEASMPLTTVESGLLIRTLAAMGTQSPTKYAVHFAIERWIRGNLDQARISKWQGFDTYPEYQFSGMLEAHSPFLKQ